MKKIFVSALTVLNFLFASAQEGSMNVSFTPVGGATETVTVADSKTVETQTAATSQNAPANQVAPANQNAPASQVATQQTSTQQTSEKPASSNSESGNQAEAKPSSSDDFDSEYFSSNNNEAESSDVHFANVFGIRAGYCAAKVASMGVYSGSMPGLTVGATDQIWFGESNVFCEVGVFFTQKGYSLKEFEPSETRLNYIEIPVLFSHRLGRETLSIAAKAGGFISCGITGKLKTFVSESSTALDFFRTEHEFDVFKEGALSRFDAGARFGLTFTIKKFMMGCRYDLGLYKIDKRDLIYGDDELMLGYKNLKTRSFQILMGFNFNNR